MTSEKKKLKLDFKKMIAGALILSVSVILFCTYHMKVHAFKMDTDPGWAESFVRSSFKTDTEQERQAEEAEAFVRSFYEAHTKEDFEKVREQLLEDADNRYVIRMGIFFELGLQKYDNITVKAHSMKDNNNYLAFVEYEAYFEGIDIGIPGSVTTLVQRQEDSQWKILMDCPEDLYEEVLQILETEKIIEWVNEVNVRFNEVIEENPEILHWLTEFSDACNRAFLKAMESGNSGNAAVEEDSTDRKNAAVYIVQEGDCLWSIAQDELGDGMRWMELYEKNKDVIGDDPNLILVEMPLNIEK